MKRYKFFIAAFGVIVAVSAFAIMRHSVHLPNAEKQIAGVAGVGTSQIEIATVGSSTEAMLSGVGNSWPGEIVSLNNLPVQPPREGTISGWFVRIGQYVTQGQVLGTLSRPPQTPDVVVMLADKSKELSEMRTHKEASHAYIHERIAQLTQLRADTERLNEQKAKLLEQDVGALSSAAAKKQLARTTLRGSITKTFPMMFTQSSIPPSRTFSTVPLKPTMGALNSNLRNSYPEIISKAWTDVGSGNAVPEQSGLSYFESAIKLANASIADGEMLTGKDLDFLKAMLIADQSMFISALGEVKDVEIESVNTRKETTEKLSEIDAEIAELEKTLAVDDGELLAAETAYGTIAGSINGGYSIVAPRNGTVSAIMKKPGDFVSPGMPVATVIGGGKNEEFVRMRLPNNIRKPKSGEIFSVIRPGFSSDAKKARLVGVGNSLDEIGSYMADAVFLEATDWPVGASVRVLSSASSSAVTVKNSAVFFGEDGKPYVWGVSEAGRVFKRSITIGRIMGENAEIYEGLKNGDRYIVTPSDAIKEDMLIGDIAAPDAPKKGEQSYEDMMRAMGM